MCGENSARAITYSAIRESKDTKRNGGKEKKRKREKEKKGKRENVEKEGETYVAGRDLSLHTKASARAFRAYRATIGSTLCDWSEGSEPVPSCVFADLRVYVFTCLRIYVVSSK